MARNKFKTTTSNQPDTLVTLPQGSITDNQWSSLADSLYTLIQMNLSNRTGLDNQLDKGNALYEMRAAQEDSDTPIPGSPTVMVPLVASVVDEFASRTAGSAILPRPLLIRGNDPVSADSAHLVEQFYNSEYQKHKWESNFRTGIHLGGRDGTSVMGVFWRDEDVERVVLADALQPDGTTKKVHQRIRMKKHSEPQFIPIELRDFMLIPAYAISIEDADAVARKIYMGEAQIQAMVNAGTLDADMCEAALSFVNTAQGDLSYDQQGYSTYTINNRIDVVDVSVAQPDGIKMNRGPIRVWQIHSSQYDMDGDGVPEENIFWLHDQSHILMGWAPYEYLGGRPYFEYAPYERPNRFYGFSIPERTQSFQDEADVQQLTRLEVLDRILNPTYLKLSGVKIAPEDMKLGLTNVLTVGAPNALTMLEQPRFPAESMQEQQNLSSQADRIAGAPAQGGTGSPSGQNMNMGGKQSAKAASQFAAIQGAQTNMIIARTRDWMLRCFEFAHMLYKQYGQDQMAVVTGEDGGTKKVTVPKELLSLDYTLGIAGQGGPLDKESRRQDWQILYQLLMQSPLVQGNLERVYAVLSSLLECYEVTEITRLIGTVDEAKQQQQSQAAGAQAKAQQDMALQILSHTDLKSAPKPQPGAQAHGSPPS
jgi:hypothetical protein